MASILDRNLAELKRPAVILALFLLLAGAEAWSQNGLLPSGLPRYLRPVQEQRQDLRNTQSSLPDAPSAVPAMQRERLQTFVETITPLIFDGGAINARMARESLQRLAPGVMPSYSASYGAPAVQKKSTVIFDKYLYSSLLREDMRHPSLTSDGFWGHASYAASRLFITRDDSGKKKFNAAYLIGALASAAVANTTYRTYRAQPASVAFGNFGSTVGSDTGRNIFQQFWPHIHQILRGHSPKVMQTAEERIASDPLPVALALTLAR
jgi:hypothetical protein